MIFVSTVFVFSVHAIEIRLGKSNATNKKPQKTRDNAATGDDPAAALSRILYGCGAVGIKAGYLNQ